MEMYTIVLNGRRKRVRIAEGRVSIWDLGFGIWDLGFGIEKGRGSRGVIAPLVMN